MPLLVGIELGASHRCGASPRSATGQEREAAIASGVKPTARRWAGLAIAPFEEMAISPVQETDGRIVSEDPTTAFRARRSRLFAKIGDRTRRGDRWLAGQAQVFVQGQNDLGPATAALKTARARFDLAETNEQRQQAFFLTPGEGTLEDCKHSPVNLTTAEGAVHAVEITLDSVGLHGRF